MSTCRANHDASSPQDVRPAKGSTRPSRAGTAAIFLILLLCLSGALACGDNLPTAQEKLRSAESSLIRAAAAERLGEIGGDEAIRSLTLHGLRDISPTVRAASARALAGKGHPQVIDLLGDLLMDSEPGVQQAAAESLAMARGDKARRYLELAYARTGSSGRAVFADALLAAGASPRRVVEEISERRLSRAMKALESGTQAERIGALHELGRSARTESVSTLIAHLGHPSISVAAAAATALGDSGERRAVQALIESLDEPNPTLRRAALEALGLLGDASAAGVLAGMALGGGDELSVVATRALTRLDLDEGVVEALCQVAAGTSEPRAAAALATSLMKWEGEAPCRLQALISAGLSAEPARRRVALAMVEAGGEELVGSEERDIIRVLLSDANDAVRIASLGAAVRLRMTEAADEMMESFRAVREADARARERWVEQHLPATFGWGDDGSRDASATGHHHGGHLEHAGVTGPARYRGRYEELMERVADHRAEMETRRRSLQGLADRGEEDVRARHREALFKEQPRSRVTLLPGPPASAVRLLQALTRALGPLAGEDALEPVSSLLLHPETKIRLAAVESLAVLDTDEAADELKSAFEEGQRPEVLVAIAAALSERKQGRELLLGGLRWAEPAAARGLIEALVAWNDEECAEAIAAFLEGPLASRAAWALVEIGGDVAGRRLREHIQQIDPPGGAHLLEGRTAVIPEDDLAHFARRSLHSDWAELRAAAARHLRLAGATDPWLEALRADFDSRVRRAAGGSAD